MAVTATNYSVDDQKKSQQHPSALEESIMIVDSNAQQIVFLKDKLLEPSVDFAPDQKVQKSRRKT